MRLLRRIPSLPALLAAALVALTAGCGDSAPRPNVVLITLDTTRADHLGCYGYSRPTSPNIDRLAAESMRYERAYAMSSWTLPTHASLFTGKFPTSHGAQYDPEGPLVLSSAVDAEHAADFRARGLGESETTLSDLLRELGYATGGIVAGPWMKKPFGLGQGFDLWDDSGITEINGRSASDVTRAAREWLGDNAERPFLLFLNYYDPHGPYSPPKPDLFLRDGMSETERINALYDAEIVFMDEQIGVLFDELRRLGVYENTWIIVTADHGEILGEHGRFGHGKSLTQPEIHIPMIVKEASATPRTGVSDKPVQQIDVMPMLMAELGLRDVGWIRGVTFEDALHPIIAEVYPLPAMSSAGHWRVLIDGDHKFSWNSGGRHMMADIARDPDESRSLLREDPDRANTMQQALLGYLAGLAKPGPADPAEKLDEETLRALRKLGYVR